MSGVSVCPGESLLAVGRSCTLWRKSVCCGVSLLALRVCVLVGEAVFYGVSLYAVCFLKWVRVMWEQCVMLGLSVCHSRVLMGGASLCHAGCISVP